MLQGQLVQQLRKELEQRAAELGAQQLALAGLGGERDSCRSAFQEATQQAEASCWLSAGLTCT